MNANEGDKFILTSEFIGGYNRIMQSINDGFVNRFQAGGVAEITLAYNEKQYYRFHSENDPYLNCWLPNELFCEIKWVK